MILVQLPRKYSQLNVPEWTLGLIIDRIFVNIASDISFTFLLNPAPVLSSHLQQAYLPAMSYLAAGKLCSLSPSPSQCFYEVVRLI